MPQVTNQQNSTPQLAPAHHEQRVYVALLNEFLVELRTLNKHLANIESRIYEMSAAIIEVAEGSEPKP